MVSYAGRYGTADGVVGLDLRLDGIFGLFYGFAFGSFGCLMQMHNVR